MLQWNYLERVINALQIEDVKIEFRNNIFVQYTGYNKSSLLTIIVKLC